MIRNFFKTAWRSINKYRAYSMINIVGLTLGISSCLIIFLVVKYELGYDRFNKKADRIYRITLHALDYNPCISLGIATAVRNDFSELEAVTQVWYRQSAMIRIGQKRFTEKGYAFADEYLARVFDYQWMGGNPNTALAEPNTIVLTESLAKKYFGTQDAMGQLINMDGRFDLKVTGSARQYAPAFSISCFF
jgi:hypothetical protein